MNRIIESMTLSTCIQASMIEDLEMPVIPPVTAKNGDAAHLITPTMNMNETKRLNKIQTKVELRLQCLLHRQGVEAME